VLTLSDVQSCCHSHHGVEGVAPARQQAQLAVVLSVEHLRRDGWEGRAPRSVLGSIGPIMVPRLLWDWHMAGGAQGTHQPSVCAHSIVIHREVAGSDGLGRPDGRELDGANGLHGTRLHLRGGR
jgi:hypothetical protein